MLSRGLLSASALATTVLAQNVNLQGADSLTLLDNAIQLGSQFDGTDAIGASDEQVPSLTSVNNFINFCAGKELTNGLQITTGSCNGIPHGDIPAKDKMISAIIVNPKNGDVVQSGQTFNIQVQMSNFEPGSFTNAFATYYAVPQFLNDQGVIIGHTHVTVQDLGATLNPTTPPDPTQFAFFKGINDAGNGQGLLAATVDEGLPPGNYRVCTIVSASNHQPVLMPVAQRGAQDDCTKFVVVGDDFDVNNAANNGQGGIDGADQAQQAVELGPGAIDPNADDAADAGQDDAADAGQDDNQGNNDDNNDGNNDNNNQQGNDADALRQQAETFAQQSQGQGQGNDQQQQQQGQGNNQQQQQGQGNNNQQQQQQGQGNNQQQQGQGNNQQQQGQGNNQQQQGQGNNQQQQAQGNDQQQQQGQGNNQQQQQGQGNNQQQQQGQGNNQQQQQGQGNNSQQQQGQGNNQQQNNQGQGSSADALRAQAESFAQQSQGNNRLARFAKRSFVA